MNLKKTEGISRRDFLAAAGGASLALAAGSGLAGCSGAPEARPNILIIMCDQLSWRALGVAGDRFARTPNIDSLAAGGVRFTRAYTACPLCQPARASLWTGRPPHETGVDSNGVNYPVPTVPESMPTLGEIFVRGGYRAVNFGKTHDAGSLRGFEIAEVADADIQAENPAWPVDYDSRRDGTTTAQTVSFLNTYREEKPFIAVASLNNPHDICNWIGHFEGPHEDSPIPGELPPLPENFEIEDLEKRPLPIRYLCCSHRRLRMAAQWSPVNYRHYLAAYYHYIDRVDRQIGRILGALAARGDSDNTLVVFMSDHGDGMASHRMVTKQVSFYEETTRVPLIFRGPGVNGGGKTLETPIVSLLDILPTLCSYAGLTAPEDIHGIDLTPLLRGEKSEPGREYVYSEWQTEWGYTVSPGRMIRTDGYKYTRYVEGDGEELYDLKADPGERRTLVDDPSHRKALEYHRELLVRQVELSRDPFFSQPVKAAPRWRSHRVGYMYHEGPSAPEVEE